MPQEEKKKGESPPPTVEVRDISIAIDSYDDIFSDFDPRPYSTREISEDFLKEIEKRMREGERGEVEVRFYIANERRNQKIEEQIVKRLQSYFRGKARELKKEDEKIKQKGIRFVGLGLVLMLFQVYFVELELFEPAAPLLEVLLVPFAWFSVWVGLESLIEGRGDVQKERERMQKISRAKCIFLSEEESRAKEISEDSAKVK